MGVIKDRHGTYYARVKVPERLQVAVARVLDRGKKRQSFLKKSLGTKDLKAANVRAKPVLAGFDRVIRDATAIAAQEAAPPAMRSSLNAAEIARMSEALYAKLLADDEAFRFGGRAFVADGVEWIRRNQDADFELPYPIESVREHGWKPEQLAQQKENLVHELATMQEALALGDITAVVDDVSPVPALVKHRLAEHLRALSSHWHPSEQVGVAIARATPGALQRPANST